MWEHAKQDHVQELEARNEGIESFRREYANKSALKRLVALPQAEHEGLGP